MENEKNIFTRMANFFKDVRSELKKITWPNKYDMYKTTLAVIVSSVVFGIYLFGIDYIFAQIVKKVIGFFK